MTDPAIRVEGLDPFRRALRDAGGDWPKELAKVNRTIAKDEASEARKFALGTGPMQAHFAGSIYGTGTAKSASIAVRGKANAAYWGAKRKSGWYGGWRDGKRDPQRAAGYADGPPQFPKWVGQNWTVGKLGEGPLAINPAIAHDKDRIGERFTEAIQHLYRKAFSN